MKMNVISSLRPDLFENEVTLKTLGRSCQNCANAFHTVERIANNHFPKIYRCAEGLNFYTAFCCSKWIYDNTNYFKLLKNAFKVN